MKNYITAAAFLAAGVAFANAGESDLKLLTLDMVSDWTSVSLTKPTDNKVESSNVGFAWEGSDLTESWQLSFTWVSTNTSTNNIQIFGSDGTAGTTGASGLVLEYNPTTSELYLGTRGGDTKYATIANVTLPTSETAVVITYLASNDTSTYASTVVLSYGDRTATGAAPADDTKFLNGANSGTRLWSNGGADKLTGITLSSASAIPEPSAFGMLAGLGALALVATRRRRR